MVICQLAAKRPTFSLKWSYYLSIGREAAKNSHLKEVYQRGTARGFDTTWVSNPADLYFFCDSENFKHHMDRCKIDPGTHFWHYFLVRRCLWRWKSVMKLVQSVFYQSFFIKIAPKSITVETPIVNEVLVFLTSKKEWVLPRNCPSAFPIHSQQNDNYCVNSARSTTTHQSRRPVDAG